MEDIDKYLYIGDNGEKDSNDRNIGDFGELTEMIKAMPKLDNKIIHYSQYAKREYFTGCTIFSAINAVCTIANKQLSEGQIAEVYKVAQSLGFKPGYGWSRGRGLNAVMKWWNKTYPNNQFMYFGLNLFSEEFYSIMDKLGILNVSIRVDSAYWRDARGNLYIDGTDYATSGGHATTMMRPDDYICVDSVPQNTGNDPYTPMIYEWGPLSRVEELNSNGNIRTDAHVIIFNNWLKEYMPEEEKRKLKSWKFKLGEAIELNKRFWNNTSEQKEKVERNRQNNYNRGKLKIIESLLK